MASAAEKVRKELARYEHPLFTFSCREKGEAVEVIIDFRDDFAKTNLGLHTYYFEMHPRDPKRHKYVVSRHIDAFPIRNSPGPSSSSFTIARTITSSRCSPARRR